MWISMNLVKERNAMEHPFFWWLERGGRIKVLCLLSTLQLAFFS